MTAPDATLTPRALSTVSIRRVLERVREAQREAAAAGVPSLYLVGVIHGL